MSVLLDPIFHEESAAYDFFETVVWPDGPVCPRCGANDKVYALKGASTRIGLRKCGHCRKPFTVKIGTIFEGSNVKMHLWLRALYLLSASKMDVTTMNLQQAVGVTQKTARSMAERIRRIMPIFEAAAQ